VIEGTIQKKNAERRKQAKGKVKNGKRKELTNQRKEINQLKK